MRLRKSFCLCVAVVFLSACDQVETVKDKVSGLFGGGLKIGEVYRALDGDTLRVVSKDEVEDKHGMVGKYTVEGDKVRVVMGGVKSIYYKITPDGLQEEGRENRILYSPAKYEKAEIQDGLVEGLQRRDRVAIINALNKGANPNLAYNMYGTPDLTPLAWAVLFGDGDIELIKLLLSKGADVNARITIRGGDRETILKVLSLGLGGEMRKAGAEESDIAKLKEVASMLKSAGAKE